MRTTTAMAGIVHADEATGAPSGFEAVRLSDQMPRAADTPFFDQAWKARA
jgi:hypothetical protein